MKFKDDVIADRFNLLHPRAQLLATEMDAWTVRNYGHELMLTATTSTAAEDKLLQRVSDTHRTGRAFDIRVSDMTEDMIADFCAFFRKKYPTLGAFTGNAYQLIVYKPHGTGPHLHIQLKRTFAVRPTKDKSNV